MNKSTDFNDLGDPGLIQECIAQAQPVPSNDEVSVGDVTSTFSALHEPLPTDAANDVHVPEPIVLAFQRLAAMEPVEYEQVRKHEAKTLDIRVATLDAEVQKARVQMGAKGADIVDEDAEFNTLDDDDDIPEQHGFDAGAENVCNKMNAAGVQPNFFVTKKGVFWRDPETKDRAKPKVLHVCTELRVTALVRDPASGNWGRVLEFPDADGVMHKWVMPMALLAGDGVDLRKELVQQGLEISPGQQARSRLIEYITGCKPLARGRCVQKTGWFQSMFVLPDRTLGASTEQVLYQSEKASRHYAQAGTLGEWQQHIANLCGGNSRLVLAVSAAFAAPLLELVGQDSGGVHFVGPSSIGKTTMLGVGASVFGGPSYIQTWRATGNGLEGLCALHNDTLLVLDEMGEVDPKEAGSIAYMIGNGVGKARSDRHGDTRECKTWRLLFLSSGEVGLAQHMTEGGKTARVGQEVRLIDLPADAGAGHGAFEELHGFESGSHLSNALREATRNYYGTAGLVFLEAVTANIATLPDKIKDAVAAFVDEYLPENAGGQVARVCARFAIMAVAGEVATAYGVTGWEADMARKGAAICFKAWLDQRGGAGNGERTKILATVRAFFETHGEARFADLRFPYDRPTINRAGFRGRGPMNDHDEYYVLREAYTRDVCAGFNPRTVTQVLLDEGWLQPSKDGKSSQKKSLPGLGETRVYVLTAAMWENSDVD